MHKKLSKRSVHEKKAKMTEEGDEEHVFGTRFLHDESKAFTENCWDDVQLTEEQVIVVTSSSISFSFCSDNKRKNALHSSSRVT